MGSQKEGFNSILEADPYVKGKALVLEGELFNQGHPTRWT